MLAWLESLGYTVKHGPEIPTGERLLSRTRYGPVMLVAAVLMATRAKNAAVQLRGNMQEMHIAASNGMIVQGQIRGKATVSE